MARRVHPAKVLPSHLLSIFLYLHDNDTVPTGLVSLILPLVLGGNKYNFQTVCIYEYIWIWLTKLFVPVYLWDEKLRGTYVII